MTGDVSFEKQDRRAIDPPRVREVSWIVPVLDDAEAARALLDSLVPPREPSGEQSDERESGAEASDSPMPVSPMPTSQISASELPASSPRLPKEILIVDASESPGDYSLPSGVHDVTLRVLRSQPGLARQQNLGAWSARGDVLFFVHSDVRPPTDWYQTIASTLDRSPRVVGGAFRLDLGPGLLYRAIAWGVQLRERWLRLGPFGDQGLFVRASVFRAVRGFDATAVVEDFDLVRRLRRRGEFRVVASSIVASTRRWARYGVLRTTLRNQWFLLAAATRSKSRRRRRAYQAYRVGGR